MMTSGRRRRRDWAFTLVELMIVIAIIGVLSVLATYGVRRYLIHAKTAEVRNALGQMAKDAKASYDRESMNPAILAPTNVSSVVHNLCTDATTSVPANMTFVKGQKYQSGRSEWGGTATAGYRCLRFIMDDPQYYMYSYAGTSGPAGMFTTYGWGDLNGDGTTSTFMLAGSVHSAVVLISPSFVEISPDE